MKQPPNTNFADRLKVASEAKKAMLAKFQPKAAAPDPLFEQRAALRAAELEELRRQRAEAKAAAKLAVVEAKAAAEESELDAKRRERKERKASLKADARAKREAKTVARAR